MTSAEIARLIAEMIVEDAKQPTLSKDEFPETLFECLCFDMMTRLPGRPTPIELPNYTDHVQTRAETYAASLPADDFVNNPGRMTPAEFAAASVAECW